jgi:GTP-binding protein
MTGSPACEFTGSFYDIEQLPKDGRPQVAVAGRSNVGKSSLLNRIVGRRKMAKVSSTPGKTQAVNLFLVNKRFYLVDLPGYGYAKLPKKVSQELSRLLQAYLTQSRDLIGLVLLLDSRRDLAPTDFQLINLLAERQLPVVVAVTKADKVGRSQLAEKVRQVASQLGLPAIPFSVLTGVGKRELMGAVNNLVTEYLRGTKAS